MNKNGSKSPVLLLGWIPRIVNTVARSLNNYGVAVDVVSFSKTLRSPSSSIRHSYLLPNPCLDPDKCVAELLDLSTRNGYDMLMPTDDPGLALLAERGEALRNRVHVASPDADALRVVLNKTLTTGIARRCGITVPGGFTVNSLHELKSVLDEMSYPVIIKPSKKTLREGNLKSCLVRSKQEAIAKFGESNAYDIPLLVEQFCEGAGVGIEVLMHGGEAQAIFQHRRLKEFPYRGGFSVLAIAEHPNPKLVESSLSLLKAMKWDGVAMVEFKINARTGEAVLLEVNGRYWGSLGLPIAAGIDFPLYHWQLIHGEVPNVPKLYRVGTRWRWTVGYLARLHELIALAVQSNEGRQALKSTLRDLSVDFSPAVSDASFSWSDPSPSVAELVLAGGHFALYDAKAVLRRLLNRRMPDRYQLSKAD